MQKAPPSTKPGVFMKLAVTLAALATLALGGPADSQQRTFFGREVTTAEAARTLHDFSRCVVTRSPGRARDILSLDSTTEEYHDRIRTFAQTYSHCAPRGHRLAFSSLPFAGDMAELLLRADSSDLAARVAYDPARPPLAARSESEAMALCAVRAAPAKVSAVLATGVFSPEEAAALHELMPEVRSCLAAGASLRVNRMGLRAMLALAAYRLAEHNRAPMAARTPDPGS
jgi:hypothetical protein